MTGKDNETLPRAAARSSVVRSLCDGCPAGIHHTTSRGNMSRTLQQLHPCIAGRSAPTGSGGVEAGTPLRYSRTGREPSGTPTSRPSEPRARAIIAPMEIVTVTQIVAGVLGVVLIAWVLWDVFQTVIVPRPSPGRYRIARNLTRTAILAHPPAKWAARAPTPARREGMLGDVCARAGRAPPGRMDRVPADRIRPAHLGPSR